MKVLLSIGRQPFRLLPSVAFLALLILFWPVIRAFWNTVNKGDPMLELLATLLAVVILALIAVVVAHARAVRQRT